jgi:hypothetical protein
MKAIEILTAKKGRPVDVLEDALQPGNMTIKAVLEFVGWLMIRIHDRTPSYIDIANAVKYSLDISAAQTKPLEHPNLFRNTRMLALLAIDARGFGGKGRRERKAQCRELLRICRKHEKEMTNEQA